MQLKIQSNLNRKEYHLIEMNQMTMTDYDYGVKFMNINCHIVYLYLLCKVREIKDCLTIRLNDYDGPKGVQTSICAKIGP